MNSDRSESQLRSTPVIIAPSTEEIEKGELSSRNLEIAIRSLHQDGMVVVKDVIESSKLDFLNERMLKDAYDLSNRGENSPFNYNKGNIQQDPPPTKPYFDPAIFLNSIAIQISSTHLGPQPKWTFCSGNTALPPTTDSPPQSQPIHSDADFDHPKHPFALVINVPLVTMTPENGSTEVWLGTHNGSGLHVQEGRHGDRASGRIKVDLLEEQRGIRPPSQPIVPKGSVIVRDLRLWHGGKPNLSSDPRVMLAMIHFAPWYRNPMKLELSEEVKGIVDTFGSKLEIPIDWAPEAQVEKSYIERGFGNSYFFDQLA